MIITTYNIRLYHKSDYDLLEETLKRLGIPEPVYILDYKSHIEFSFDIKDEYCIFGTEDFNIFDGFDFTDDIGKGGQEIKLRFHVEQQSGSTDSWGRPLEELTNKVYFLIKKEGIYEKGTVSSKVKVLFEDKTQEYFINICDERIKNTERIGYSILNEFREKLKSRKDVPLLNNKIYETPRMAFYAALNNELQKIVEEDFTTYLKAKKKKRSKKS